MNQLAACGDCLAGQMSPGGLEENGTGHTLPVAPI